MFEFLHHSSRHDDLYFSTGSRTCRSNQYNSTRFTVYYINIPYLRIYRLQKMFDIFKLMFKNLCNLMSNLQRWQNQYTWCVFFILNQRHTIYRTRMWFSFIVVVWPVSFAFMRPLLIYAVYRTLALRGGNVLIKLMFDALFLYRRAKIFIIVYYSGA